VHCTLVNVDLVTTERGGIMKITYTVCDICGRTDKDDGAIFKQTDFEQRHRLYVCESCHSNGALVSTYDLSEDERRSAKRLGSMTTDLPTCEWMWVAYV